MRFGLVDLQVFLHACESGSMTAAAERSCLTLAAVSARLRRLEDAAGVTLLRRHARGVEPTAAGAALAVHARRVLHEVARLRQGLDAGRLRETLLLANTSALARPLAGVARLLADEGDPVRLAVRESTSEATVQALQSKLASVGIVSDAVACKGLRAETLGPDPLVIVTARDHPLAARGQVRFAEALAYDWVAWGDDTALGMHLDMQAQRLGLPVRRRATYPRYPDFLDLVAAGLGVSALPAGLLPAHLAAGALAAIPLAESWAQRSLLVCVNPLMATAQDLAVFEGVKRIWAELSGTGPMVSRRPAARRP